MDPGQPLPPAVLKQLETGWEHLLDNKYYILASTVMLLYDHILTFERERVYIWNQRKSIPSYLFFVFRYVTPIVSILNLVAEHNPHWSGKTCSDWIWLPVAVGPIISVATGVILILRVHAIYARSRWILYITVPVYLAQLGVMGWSIDGGVPAQLPPGFIGCVPSEKPGTGIQLSALYIAALVFDAMIFALTLGRAIYMHITKSTVPLVTLIVRDGTLYFMVIFIVNLVNVFLLTLAPPDIGAINAPFASMITAILVARLMLNLREAGQKLHVSHGAQNNLNQASVGTWIVAPQSKGTGRTSPTYLPGPLGTTGASTFQNMMALEEFDIPLNFDDEDEFGTNEFDTTGAPHEEDAYELDTPSPRPDQL